MKVYEFLLEDGSVFSTVPTDDPERDFENTKLHTPVVSYREVVEAEPPLEELKENKRLKMKVIRDEKEAGGFFYLGKVLDSDANAVQRITTTAQSYVIGKMAGKEMPGLTWTTKDNGLLPLSADELIGMPMALTIHASKVHEIYNQLKIKIAEAETTEQLNQIHWPEEATE